MPVMGGVLDLFSVVTGRVGRAVSPDSWGCGHRRYRSPQLSQLVCLVVGGFRTAILFGG